MALRQVAGTSDMLNLPQSFMRALQITAPIYAALTLICALCLLAGGVSLFDALCISFSTLSTGGMNLGIEGWVLESAYVKFILSLFMLAGAMNFAQYYLFLRRRSHWRQDLERQVYLAMIVVVAIIAMDFFLEEERIAEGAQSLFAGGWGEILFDPRWRDALGESLFAAISVMSTTNWHEPELQLPFLLVLLLTFIGGMTVSSAGGLKVMRILLLLRQSRKELSVLAYPHDVKGVYFEGAAIHIDLMQTVWVFFALFNAAIAILMLVLAMTGLSFEESLAASVAAIANAGPMVDIAGIDGAKLYGGLPDIASWAMSLGMIGGRIELMTLLSLFSPIYWKR